VGCVVAQPSEQMHRLLVRYGPEIKYNASKTYVSILLGDGDNIACVFPSWHSQKKPFICDGIEQHTVPMVCYCWYVVLGNSRCPILSKKKLWHLFCSQFR
jgi:hypothetical protein